MGTAAETVRAAGYVRVSQERNARNGYGLDSQEADVNKHVDYKDWLLTEIYREEGASGYDRRRPVLDRLIADARAGKFDVVIFPSIDRAGRSVKDVIELDATLRAAGVQIVFVREGIDTSTPTGELYRNIMAAVAQFEGKLIYERLSKGKRRKAAQGGYTGGWLPYGYRRDGGRVVVVPDQAEAVRRMFGWRAEGRTLEWICERLTDEGVPTHRGGMWGVSTVRRMLRNLFYTGRIKVDGEVVRGQHEAVVPTALFRRCNP